MTSGLTQFREAEVGVRRQPDFRLLRWHRRSFDNQAATIRGRYQVRTVDDVVVLDGTELVVVVDVVVDVVDVVVVDVGCVVDVVVVVVAVGAGAVVVGGTVVVVVVEVVVDVVVVVAFGSA